MNTHTTIRKDAHGNYREVNQPPLREEIPVRRRTEPAPVYVENSPAQADITEPQTERELLSLRPVMFASYPLTFLFLWGVVLLAAAGAVGLWMIDAWFMGMACLLVGCAAALGLLTWWLKLQFVNLKITEKRTVLRKGIFSRKTNEVQHDDVRNMKVNQSFFQRLLGVGDFALSSSGQDDMEIVLKGVQNPNEAVEIIRRYQ